MHDVHTARPETPLPATAERADHMNQDRPDEQDRPGYPGTAYGIARDAHLNIGDASLTRIDGD